MFVVLATATTAAAAERRVSGGAYLDTGYLASSNKPDNVTWRSKGTSWKLDQVVVNNLTLFANKPATPKSRWGFALGFQTGYDIDNLVTTGSSESADIQKHIYYTYLEYLFPLGGGLLVRGGLVPGHLGYENFQAWYNPTYTRVYSGDMAPYFNYGITATYDHGDTWSASLMLLNAYNYLEAPNSAVSMGAQGTWAPRPSLGFTLNMYAGPEQADHDLEHWLLLGEIIAEWRTGQFLFAGGFGYGGEDQHAPVLDPGHHWSWGALWARWNPHAHWGVTVRPEYLFDPDGGISGARQSIHAITASAEYRMSPLRMNTLSARAEYRFDRSTGPDGGFYEGDNNTLVPDQHLFIIALLWRFDTSG
jgi:hypothetical protein